MLLEAENTKRKRKVASSVWLFCHFLVLWNVTPLLWVGSILIFFEAFYFARLEVTDPLALPTQEGGNKGSNSLQVLLNM